MTDAMSSVKFSSQVFMVIMVNTNSKNEKSNWMTEASAPVCLFLTKALAYFFFEDKMALTCNRGTQSEVTSGFLFFLHIREVDLYIFHSRTNHKSILFHHSLSSNR